MIKFSINLAIKHGMPKLILNEAIRTTDDSLTTGFGELFIDDQMRFAESSHGHCLDYV
jgi:hypothetical protein